MSKSNIEYLREEVKKYITDQNQFDDINEWIESIEQELKESWDTKAETLQSEIDSLNNQVEELEEQLNESVSTYDLEEIDCGIGKIQYLQPDNLKLQIVMEELKEKMEHKALFSI